MKKLLAGLAMLALLAVAAPLYAQQGQAPAGQKGAKKRVTASFEEMDKNKDGKISKEEWTGNPRAFDRLDANHDGFIDKEEFKARGAGKAGGAKAKKTKGTQ
jgi:Ca2+-binding EF-hand superfamily protein